MKAMFGTIEFCSKTFVYDGTRYVCIPNLNKILREKIIYTGQDAIFRKYPGELLKLYLLAYNGYSPKLTLMLQALLY